MGRLFGTMATIHSVSHDAQENLLTYFPSLDRKKCRVIANGIEVARFAEISPRDLRSELELGEEHFLIGFMGRFMAQKGFRNLVEAVEYTQPAGGAGSDAGGRLFRLGWIYEGKSRRPSRRRG